jgi:hypothetical protein
MTDRRARQLAFPVINMWSDAIDYRTEAIMKVKAAMISALLLIQVIPALAGDKKDKKKQPNRAMIEKMEAVPCGARERGLSGIGSVFASAGVTHVNSDEKLCPQYLLRTDDMEYHIRPTDGKHPDVLPIGKEGEFKIKKDEMYLRVPDGDRKMRTYQVVAAKPLGAEEGNASYRGTERSGDSDRDRNDRNKADSDRKPDDKDRDKDNHDTDNKNTGNDTNPPQK